MKLFGVGIDSYMVLQKAIVKFLNVPILIRLCSDLIILKALNKEGIFRIPGNQNIINEISSSFENGSIPDFSGSMGPEEVTGAFKKYLRELPQPLLSDDSLENKISDGFAEVLTLSSPKKKIIRLRHLIRKLSIFKRSLLKEMLYVLYLVSLESKTNKMDAFNLSTIFGEMGDILSNKMAPHHKSELCAFMINYFPSIFHQIDEIPPISCSNMKPTIISNLEHNNLICPLTVYFDMGTFKSVLLPQTATIEDLKKTSATN